MDAATLSLTSASLETVLSYQNDELVRRFQNKLSVDSDMAYELFTEVKRFLWLSVERKKDFELGLVPNNTLKIDHDLELLDQAWHLFILSTKDYIEFCQTYFGTYLHHHPIPTSVHEEMRLSFQRDPVAFGQKQKEEFKEMLSWIYDRAGKEVVQRWFLDKLYASDLNANQISQ